MTHYLVTGAAGFVGSRVAGMLLEAGHQVTGIDELNTAYDVTLKHHRLEGLQGRPGFRFLQRDVAEKGSLDDLLSGEVGGVFHLAARAGVRQSIRAPEIYLRANGQGTLELLESCRRHDVDRVLVASTSSLYGKHNPLPFSESANTDLPLSPYAASKKAAESMTAAFSHLYGLKTVVPRYFTVYGPAGRPDMSIFRFVRWIREGQPIIQYGDGTQQRDFTFIDDIARGTLLALEKARGFDIVNLGSDSPVTLRHLIETIETKVGKKAQVDEHPPATADVPATWADITKAREWLGWAPQTTLDAGVERTVAWYDANRGWAQHLSLEDSL